MSHVGIALQAAYPPPQPRKPRSAAIDRTMGCEHFVRSASGVDVRNWYQLASPVATKLKPILVDGG
jgi:hypothetical protein